MTDQERYREVKKKLDSVGPGFCLAKWNQVTIHLGVGQNHSCHHPGPRPIVESEVLRNPTHLHNTSYKKRRWQEMLEGKRPAECEYCWKIEDNTSEFSDRVFKSSEPWAWPTLDEIKNSHWSQDYYPRYVELSFSNRCNYKCLYCNPSCSSTWNSEAKKFGPVKLENYTIDGPIEEKEEFRCQNIEQNPLVKAFWKWWPDLVKHIHSFRLTGGEPLLVPESYQIMDYIIEHRAELSNFKFFGINTNLGMTDEQFEKFLCKFKQISEIIPEAVVFTSIESGKKESEYVRCGLDYDRFWKRVERLVSEIPRLTLTVMATYNILSVSSYLDTIKKVYKLKEKYHSSSRLYGTAVMLDTSYIRFPTFLDIRLGSKESVKFLDQCIEYVKDRKQNWTAIPAVAGFSELEIEKLSRIKEYWENSVPTFDVARERRNLKTFLTTVDSRRDTNYQSIFPELSNII